MNPVWRKSSYSNDTGGDCVEVAELAVETRVRDTMHRDLGHLSFGNAEWAALLTGVKARAL